MSACNSAHINGFTAPNAAMAYGVLRPLYSLSIFWFLNFVIYSRSRILPPYILEQLRPCTGAVLKLCRNSNNPLGGNELCVDLKLAIVTMPRFRVIPGVATLPRSQSTEVSRFQGFKVFRSPAPRSGSLSAYSTSRTQWLLLQRPG